MPKWVGIVTIGVGLVAGGCGSTNSAAPQPPSAQPGPLSTEQAATNFVTPIYANGVPYDRARQLGDQAVPALMPMLDVPLMKAHRTNIAVTLGILGTKEAEDRLITLVRSSVGPLPEEELRLRLVALSSLGYAVNAPEPGDALGYLLDGVEPGAWAKIEWRLPTGDDPSTRLRDRAIMALGLSGRPEALRKLLSLQLAGLGGGGGGGGRGGGAGSGGGGRGTLSDAERARLAEAIYANSRIAAVGLSEYYKSIDSR